MRLKRLVWHLYPTYILLAVLVLIGLGWYVSVVLKSFHYAQTAADLKARAELVAEQLHGSFSMDNAAQLATKVRILGERSGTRITIIREDGVVLADSDEDSTRMENHGKRPEVVSTQSREYGQAVRFSRTLGQTLMYVAIPFVENDQVLGTVRTAISVSDIDETLIQVYRRLVLAGVLIIIIAAPVSWLLSRRISRPLEQMTAAAQRFSQGQLDVPLIESGSVETSRLAKALNSMAGDLSELIEKEVEQRSEIEAILGCMVEGIIAIDNNEQIIRLNTAAADLFGVSTKVDPGCPIQGLIRHSGLLRFVTEALQAQGPLEDELVLLSPEKRYLHVQAAPLTGKLHERIGVLIVLHDLTHMRQLESVRRDFVANVSHELKTPITAIRGAVETLLDEEGFDQACQRFLQIIFKQSERLNALVEDLLDLSRIEQGSKDGSWELEETRLMPLLEEAKGGCESLLARQQTRLKVVCGEDLRARVNAPLLEQAIINLLSNAIKYSPSGSEVMIEAKDLSEEVTISVKDTGPGIAEEHLPRLFERFYRIDQARSRDLGGTGLGLAIVKHICNAHGGKVTVQSQVGQGSIFTMILPKNHKGKK